MCYNVYSDTYDTPETYETPEGEYMGIDDFDLYAKDKAFNSDVKDSIELEIMKGSSPEAAAVASGVSVHKFRDWMKMSELFRSFVMGCVTTRNSHDRKKILEIIEVSTELSDRERVELLMKNLASIDEDYGVKKSRVSVMDDKKTVSPMTKDQIESDIDRYRIAEDAEKISNGDSDDA